MSQRHQPVQASRHWLATRLTGAFDLGSFPVASGQTHLIEKDTKLFG